MYDDVPCEKCGNLVAETSTLCPVCGHNPNKNLHRFQSCLFIVFLPIGAVGILGLFGHNNESKTDSNSTSEISTTNEQLTILSDANVTDDSRRDDQIKSEGLVEAPPANPNLPEFRTQPIVDEAVANSAESQAIAKALATGINQEWRAGGVKGLVKVKEARKSGQENCKRYRVERDRAKSAYSTVCRSEDGGWKIS